MDGGSSSRRGMSPLIATVLLMAFAVALGGMIMNWSIDAGSRSSECGKISVTVQHFCSTEKGILLTLRNNRESAPLSGIKINLLESSIESTLSIKDSSLEPGQLLEDIQIPAATGPYTKADILGVVGDANPITCTEPLARADPIQPC
jgi:flagellin-like protein